MSAQIPITGGGAFTNANISNINSNFSTLFAGFTPGNIIYLNPSATSNAQAQDGSAQHPYTDLSTAYGKARNGMNDVILIVGNGAASGSVRISATFTWAKDATHLIGITPPVFYSQRARIAPPTTATAFANFFVVSSNGCTFQNIQFYQGFATGTTAQICMNVTGQRNYFKNCQLAGMNDTASATDTGSRNLKIGAAGSGENVFEDCVVGDDTTPRTVANASVEFAGGTPRNVFRRCYFPFYNTANGVLGILGTGAACVDRENIFDSCLFVNSIKSGSGTAATALLSFTNSAPGGLIVFKGCMSIGFTKFGDTNGLANSYIDMSAVSGSAGGLAVNPS
jgi:hypothetical protein